ncbi:MAG: type II toxin-antitoxin system VapC family toxin [Methylophilaceae bacterium]
MKIILDTHIFLWAISAPGKLSDKKRFEIEARSNTIFVSAMSIAELMIKSSIGKLQVDFDPNQLVNESGFELLAFGARDALWLKELPFHHKDPFDRMLIAQALENKYTLMTEDPMFKLYGCKLICE